MLGFVAIVEQSKEMYTEWDESTYFTLFRPALYMGCTNVVDDVSQNLPPHDDKACMHRELTSPNQVGLVTEHKFPARHISVIVAMHTAQMSDTCIAQTDKQGLSLAMKSI